MKEFTYTIKDPLGIHARPAGLVCKKLGEFTSSITIERADNHQSCEAKKLLALMKLKVKQGDTIIVKADGADEEDAIKTAESYLSANL